MIKKVIFDWPILSGSISTAKSLCGKPGCACKGKPPRLHGIYYRWTGFIDGKRTTKTISREEALECAQRIQNLRKLQHKIEILINNSLKSAPWVFNEKKNREKK